MTTAVYPGSFDPLTNGHLDIVHRAARLFEQVVVAVADNPARPSMFTQVERVDMIRDVVKSVRGVTVESFDGLIVDYAKRKKAGVIVRGVRTVSDFEYEYQMALTNRTFAKDIETVFILTGEEYSFLSSKLIKEAASLGGDISAFVPKEVESKIRKRISEGTRAIKRR